MLAINQSAEKVLGNLVSQQACGVGRGHKNARQSPAPNEGVSDIGDLSLGPPYRT